MIDDKPSILPITLFLLAQIAILAFYEQLQSAIAPHHPWWALGGLLLLQLVLCAVISAASGLPRCGHPIPLLTVIGSLLVLVLADSVWFVNASVAVCYFIHLSLVVVKSSDGR